MVMVALVVMAMAMLGVDGNTDDVVDGEVHDDNDGGCGMRACM